MFIYGLKVKKHVNTRLWRHGLQRRCWSAWLFVLYQVFQFQLTFTFIVVHGAITGVTTYSHDIAELTFLSKANEFRLHESEYHVVNVHVPAKNSSYTMHLSRPHDLFHPEHLDIPKNEVDQYECVYTGTLTSSDGKEVGMASLSSCFHETGFEGLLLLGNEHYQITPTTSHTPFYLSRQRRLAKSNSGMPQQKSNFKVVHNLKSAAASKAKTTPSKGKRIDSKRLSDEAMKKARQQMIKDQESLDDESDDDDDSGGGRGTTSSGPAYGARQTTKKMSKKNQKQNKNRVIELGIFTDEAFYRKWAEKYPQDTVKKINQYVLTLVNNMNYLYQQPSMGPKISFRLVNVGIQKDIPNGLTPSTTAERYLDNFCNFAGKKDKNGAIWDHAMMITGLELKDETGGDNLGIAFTSTMCLRYWSCSVVEYNKGFETGFTAAHELGHSLGIEHDGDLMNVKCDPAKFIMAAIAGNGQINWSQCSSVNAQNFLASGDPRRDVKDPSTIPRCLTKKGSKRSSIRYKTGKFPGNVFNTKRQCQQACGDNCVPYSVSKAPYNNICVMLHCQDPSQQIIAAHPALEGTSCGQGKQRMCRNGRCQ